MHYLILDVFPRPDSAHFQDRAGATAVCWVREDVAEKSGGYLRYLTTKLLLEGWVIANVVALHTVTEETYQQNPDGIELFQQAQHEGFASSYRIRRRETIGGAGAGYGLKPEFQGFVRKVVDSGAASLYSEVEGQWATAELGGGGSLVPLCRTSNELAAWQAKWRTYAPKRLSYQVLDTEWLQAIYAGNLWIGVGLAPGSLTMFHPLALRHAMTARS
jgi:hypothetical protein